MKVYGSCYPNREPNSVELQHLVHEYEEFGFSGFRGSVDCMHLK